MVRNGCRPSTVCLGVVYVLNSASLGCERQILGTPVSVLKSQRFVAHVAESTNRSEPALFWALSTFVFYLFEAGQRSGEAAEASDPPCAKAQVAVPPLRTWGCILLTGRLHRAERSYASHIQSPKGHHSAHSPADTCAKKMPGRASEGQPEQGHRSFFERCSRTTITAPCRCSQRLRTSSARSQSLKWKFRMQPVALTPTIPSIWVCTTRCRMLPVRLLKTGHRFSLIFPHQKKNGNFCTESMSGPRLC